LQQSLSDLQLEYVDLYLIHWPVVWKRGTLMQSDGGASIVECWRALEAAVDDGHGRTHLASKTCNVLCYLHCGNNEHKMGT